MKYIILLVYSELVQTLVVQVEEQILENTQRNKQKQAVQQLQKALQLASFQSNLVGTNQQLVANIAFYGKV